VGLQRVGGDHDLGKVERGQQRLERGHLLRRATDLVLGQHRAAGVVHRRQQVHRAAVTVGWVGAAQRFVVDGHRPPPAGSGRTGALVPVGQPRADSSGQRVGVQAGKGPADGGLGRDGEVAGGVAAGAQRCPHGLGASAAHSAIAAIDRAPASTAAAARPRMATSGWRRPRAARGSGTLAR
jgi:hypothetical protein